MNAAYIGWHIPRAYEFALTSENWHNFEHACFFFTNIMFWWPIICPWPSSPMRSRWILIPYLVLADVVNTGVSAFLCFAGRLLYPSYDTVARPFGLSALNDQAADWSLYVGVRIDRILAACFRGDDANAFLLRNGTAGI